MSLVFVFEQTLTLKKRNFTLLLSERLKNGDRWTPSGPKRVYYASDLETLKSQAADLSLLKKAIQSELDIRKKEGRFFSSSDEMTVLRIHPDILPGFIQDCQKRGILCFPDGQKTNFNTVQPVKPVLKIERKSQDRIILILLDSIPYSQVQLFIPSLPMLVLSNGKIFALHEKITLPLLESIPQNREISQTVYDALINRLNAFKACLAIDEPEEKKKIVLHSPPGNPVLDIRENFQCAMLFVDYPQGIRIRGLDSTNPVFYSEKNLELERNLDEEKSYFNTLKNLGAVFQGTVETEWYLPSTRVYKILETLEEEGWLLEIKGKWLQTRASLQFTVAVDKNRIRVSGHIESEKKKAGLENVMDSLSKNLQYCEVDGETLCLIPRESITDLKALLEKGERLGGNILFKETEFPVVSRFVTRNQNTETDSGFKALCKFEEDYEGIQPHPVPKEMEEILRPYQKQGFYWLASLQKHSTFNGFLADDMGLGKTIQVLTLLLSQYEDDTPKLPSLLVVPTTLIFNWEMEIGKFARRLRYRVHAGKERGETLDVRGCHLVITSYAILRRDVELFKETGWNYLILDEAQAVKNPEAQITKAVKSISALKRLSLSGTPVENSPLDLWSHFDFLMPGFLGPLKEFSTRFGQGNKELLKELSLRTKPFILRRLKSQVCTELPPKTEITLHCKWKEDQKEAYDAALAAGKKKLKQIQGDEGVRNKTFHILEVILRLRQIACHPALACAPKEEPWQSGKLDQILYTADEILSEGHKILIFSQFAEHLKYVRNTFHNKGFVTYYLDGETKDRGAVVRSFTEESRACAFFLTLKAGGFGLNLTEASYVFLLDPWWNPFVESQAIDRSYRIGQTQPVTVYRFITRDSIEEKVLKLQESKKAVEKVLIQEANIDSVPLTEAMLENLLGD